MNKYLYNGALCAALRVEFLSSSEELFLYASALYSAMEWSRSIGEKNMFQK